MAKLIYETTLLVCSSCVIFTGTVSAVLLMLVWHNDRILGLSTRMVIALCIIIVAIFSVGFVGTIAESTNALIIYACLLILFPVSVLLVEIILRLSSLSPPPTSPAPNTSPHHNSSDTAATTSASASSNHTTSSLHNLNLNENSISFPSSDPYPSPPFNALITKPSLVPNISLNLSNNKIHWLLNEDTTTIASSSITNKIIRPTNRSSHQSTQLLATILNRPIHDDSDIIDVEHKPSSSAKHMSSNDLFTGYKQPPYIGNNGDLIFGTKHTSNKKEVEVVDRKISYKSSWPNKNNNDKSTSLNVKGNLLSRIFTASLNPSVETSIEYILIGMLIFVLFQIVISYLLAYKIRTLRIQLKVLSRTRSNQNDPDKEEEGEGEEEEEKDDDEEDEEEEKEAASSINNRTDVTNLHVVETSFYTDSICFPIVDTTNATFNDIDPATTAFNLYNCCDHHHHHHHHHHHQAASTTTDTSDNVFLQADSRPLVQVHCNPDQLGTIKMAPNTAPLGQNICSEHNHGEQILTTTNSSSIDTEDTVISSPQSSSLRATATDNTKTSRRTRSGSFRVTFDSLPEFFESSHTVSTNNNDLNHSSTIMMLQTNDVEPPNQNHYLTPSTSVHQHNYYEHQ